MMSAWKQCSKKKEMDKKILKRTTKYFCYSHTNTHVEIIFILIIHSHIWPSLSMLGMYGWMFWLKLEKEKERKKNGYINVTYIFYRYDNQRSIENCLCSKTYIHISRLLIDEAKQIKMLFMGNADGEVNNFILTLTVRGRQSEWEWVSSTAKNPQHYTSFSSLVLHQIQQKFGRINQ